MRHARSSRRLSRPSEPRQALLDHLARALLQQGRIRTTVVKAKEARRLADRLISLGKDGSIHARRRAYAVLQDRGLVKRLFADIAPRFLDCQGGYTRILRLATRPGDGAPEALLELTRLPERPTPTPAAKPAKGKPPEPSAPTPAQARPEPPSPTKPKRFFENLRELLRPKRKDRASEPHTRVVR